MFSEKKGAGLGNHGATETERGYVLNSNTETVGASSRPRPIADLSDEELAQAKAAAEKSIATEPGPTSKKRSAATEAAELAIAACFEIWHDGERAGATICRDGNHAHLFVRSAAFRRWVNALHWQARKKSLATQALAEAIATVEAAALFDGTERPTYLRTAPDGAGGVHVSLGPYRPYIHCRRDGVTAMTADSANPVVVTKGAGALPMPDLTCTADPTELIKPYVNVADDDRRLLMAQMLFYLTPWGPYPAIQLTGVKGSSKTTVARVIKRIIDPTTPMERAQPKEPRDIAVAAVNSWLLNFDNLSYLPDWLSDLLCSVATGGGFATRSLYTDDEEQLFTFRRPFILTGINTLGRQSDLADRIITYECPYIPETARRTEREFWAAFESDLPRILGAVTAALSRTLSSWTQDIEIEGGLPRMADFATFGIAAERALGWPDGAFLDSYLENIERQNEVTIENDAIAAVIMRIPNFNFEGTASELLDKLNNTATEAERKAKRWPKSAAALGAKLRRIEPNLHQVGYRIGEWRSGHRRIISISQPQDYRVLPSSPSSPSSPSYEELVSRADTLRTEIDERGREDLVAEFEEVLDALRRHEVNQ